jgi:hypothetical protein
LLLLGDHSILQPLPNLGLGRAERLDDGFCLPATGNGVTFSGITMQRYFCAMQLYILVVVMHAHLFSLSLSKPAKGEEMIAERASRVDCYSTMMLDCWIKKHDG